MKKLLLSATALVVLFAACSKDDDNTPQTSAKKYLLSQTSDEDSTVITYDVTNNMKKIQSWDLEYNSLQTSELVYENGKLVKKMMSEDEGALQLFQDFGYNSAGKLVKVNMYSSNGSKSRYDSLVYNAEGRLTALYEAAAVVDGYTMRRKNAFIWDSKGNIARQVAVAITDGIESKDSTIIDYTYDDKVNYAARQPEFSVLDAEDPVSALSANNITKSVWSYTMSPGSSSVTTIEYTYDEDGYPVTRKEIIKTIQGDEVVSTDEYSSKYRYIKK
jgi:hypothetical protein